MNKVILLGKLTRDPELRSVGGSGTAVCEIGIANNRKWRDASGELKEEVVFVDCTAWGKTAETVAKWFKKGSPILIDGRLSLSQWKDKTDGSNRSKLKVVIDTFSFVGGDKADGATPSPARSSSRPNNNPDTDINESDIPF